MADPTVPSIDFDTAAARADGVPDSAIAEFLASKVGFDLAAARADKVPDSAIVDFLAPSKAAPATEPAGAEQPKESRGTWGSDLKAGFHGTSQAMASTVAVRAAEEIEDLKKQIETFKQGEPELPAQLRHLAPQRQRQLPLLEKKLADAEKHYAAAVGETAQDASALQKLPVNEPMRRFTEGNLGEILENPGAVARGLIGQSATAMVPLIVGAALGGVTGGAIAGGATGVATGGGQEAVRILAKRGVDAKDAEAVKQALANPEIRAEIDQAFGVGQAIEGAVGAATGALGGVTVPGTTVARTVAKNVGLQAVGQGSISGAGEAAKQGIIEGELQPGKIAAAALSEALFAPVDAAAAAAHARGQAAQRPRTPEAAAEPVLRANSVDEAIVRAREVVDQPALEERAIQAEEFGNRGEQDQAAILRLFGGLNEGQVERRDDGAWFYRDPDGRDFQVREWDGRQREDTIPAALVEAQRRHYERLGVRVVYMEDDARVPFDGAVDPAQPNTIFLTNNPQRNAAQVGAHEFTHVLESTRLPDGTNFADILQQQVAAGITAEGRAYAERLFGKTAPAREAFPDGAEGDSLHADAVTSHLVRELGADIGGEAPKFQSFMPRVIEAVEARFGAAAARDAMARLIAGIRQAMTTLRNFFFKPEDMAEYGQPPLESQKWVTNLEQIHGTLARMYAERYGQQNDLRLQAVGPEAPAPRPAEPQRLLPAPAMVTPPPRPAVTPQNVFQPETYGARLADVVPGPARVDRPHAQPMGGSVAAARQRLEATPTAEGGMGRRDMTLDRNQRMSEAWARWDVMHEEVGEPEIRRIVEDSGASPDHLDQISRYYNRKEGETPRQAFESAVSRWIDRAEADAAREFNLIDTELEAPRGEKPASQPSAEDRVEAARPGEPGGGQAGRDAGGGRGPAREAEQPAAAEAEPGRVEPAAKVTEQVAEARETTNTDPTEGQKEAGNYLKGRVSFHGLPFVMENPEGSIRRGVDANGKAWEATLPADYGYISRTEGADGDQVDAYIGKHHDSQRVWVVDQIDPKTGKFDEHKVMLGMRSVTEARATYHRSFSDGSGPKRIGAITEMSLDQFKGWLENGDTKSPVGTLKEPAPIQEERAKIDAARRPSNEGEKINAAKSEPAPKLEEDRPSADEVFQEAPEAQETQPAPVEEKAAQAETPVQSERAKLDAMRERAKSAETQLKEEQAKVEALTERLAEAEPAKAKAAPARESTMIQDAGEKIGGARKDLWAERGLRLTDLEGMSEGEAYQHVTKDAVWPKPDYAKMVEGGMSPEAAALVKIIRDRLSARPGKDSPEGRRAYVTMMGYVREAYADVKTKADFRAARDKLFYDLAGWPRDRSSLSAAKEARDVVFSVYKGRSEPFRIGHADERKAQQMVEAGFPAKAEPWTRRYDVRQWSGDQFAVVGKGTGRTVDGQRFSTREEAETYARETYEKAQQSGEEAPLPTRPHLDSVRRSGADVRAGRDVGSQDFVNDFGFRGVEFGNWVAGDERAKVVNLAYDALHDMAGVLGVSAKALSLDGQLGLAFGARGSGRAAAHYEPGRLVINMTKMSGAGSLAHEWGHALDHYFGTLDTPQASRGAPRGASGWYDRTEQRASYLQNLRPEMAEAFDRLMDVIFKREKPKAEAVRDTELRIERYQADIVKMKERAAASPDTSFQKSAQRYIEQTQLQLQAAGKRLADLRDETKPYVGQKIKSSYYDEANKLSGKSGEKGYWSRPTEMFARAFESYVFDKIKAEGNQSQYLVQGVEPERYASGYKGNPYPAAERPAINAAFDHLFEVMDERPGTKSTALFSPRITGENPTREYTAELKQAFKRVGRTTESTTLWDKIAEAREDIGRKLLRETLDAFIGIKRDDPEGYMAARLANSVAGAQEVFRLHGTLKFDGSTYNYKDLNGGVRQVVKNLGPEAHDFLWWVAANRAERLKAEDRENLFSKADIAALKDLNRGDLDFDYGMPNGTRTRKREAAYMDALRRYDALNKSVLDLVKESGLVSDKVADQLWSDPFYVPFYREAADQGSTRFIPPTSGFVKQYASKKLKGGSERLRNDLWENALGNWDHMIDAALRNRASNQILQRSEAMSAAEKVATPIYENKLTNAEKLQSTWTMVDGKKQYWLVTDPMVFKAVSSLEGAGPRGPIMAVARWFSRALRYGVTANPMFAVRNLIRDTENAIAVSQISANPFKNLADGFRSTDSGDRLKNLARAIAGRDLEAAGLDREAISAMAGGALMRLGTASDAGIENRTILDTPGKLGALKDYIGDVAGAYKEALGAAEDVNRLALYKQQRAQGAPHDFASFSARDLQDFTLHGASPFVRTITDITPFLNARAQGLYKIGRVASDADKSVAAAVGGKVARSMVMRTATVLGAMTLASLALDAIYQDDPDYRKRTEFDRSTYFWFKIGDTQFRIPKGFEIAALSSMAADGIQAFFDKEMTGQRWVNNFWTQLGTNLQVQAPAVAQPVIDLATNTRGTGGPIESTGMERLEPQERYGSETTLIARGTSSAINAALRTVMPRADGPSPVQIDYLANAYGAWLATTVLGMADRAVRAVSNEPEKPSKDFWAQLTQGMVRNDPAPQSRYVDMLYSQGKKIEEAHATYLNLAKMGRTQEAREFVRERQDELRKYPAFERVKRLEGEINQQIRVVTNDPKLSGEQKRVRIMYLQALKNRAAEGLFTGATP